MEVLISVSVFREAERREAGKSWKTILFFLQELQNCKRSHRQGQRGGGKVFSFRQHLCVCIQRHIQNSAKHLASLCENS